MPPCTAGIHISEEGGVEMDHGTGHDSYSRAWQYDLLLKAVRGDARVVCQGEVQSGRTELATQ